MNKEEFLLELVERLSPLPWEEIDDRCNYYSEMIDDRMEEGLTEEEAVAEMGSIDDIASQIVSNIPLSVLVKKKMKTERKLSVWEIVLIVLGSPLWIALLLAVFAVVFSVYCVLWSVVVCLWAAFVSLVGGLLGGMAAGALFVLKGSILAGVGMVGAGLVCAGLAVFMFFISKSATKGIAWLTKRIMPGIKRSFIRKGRPV